MVCKFCGRTRNGRRARFTPPHLQTNAVGTPILKTINAAVVKLVYTLASGASERKLVEVQVLSAAPEKLRKFVASMKLPNFMEIKQRS